MDIEGIFPFALSNFHQTLSASIQDASTSMFKALVVTPCRMDLRQPTTSHKSIAIGIKPCVFSWIQTSLSINGSSKSPNFAGLPFLRRNKKPYVCPLLTFSSRRRLTQSRIRIPEPVTAAAGRKWCLSPSSCLNLCTSDIIECFG
jgi:hypothetical protein